MVACNQVNRNASVAQTNHLSPEKQASAIILPISVVDVTRNDKEIDFLIYRQLDQVLEGPSCCTAQDINGRPVMRLKAFKRAVNVRVSSMDETYNVRCPVAPFWQRM